MIQNQWEQSFPSDRQSDPDYTDIKTNNDTKLKKSSVVSEDDKKQTGNQKEYEGKEHQHNYITPVGEQNQQDGNQDREQNESLNLYNNHDSE